MSIYHFGQMKVISRSTGRSVIASSAYISGEKLYNEYDGITHDYTRKQGVAFSEIMLPENAPKEWSNRQTLWNEVEKIEKSKNSQLARSFDVGLQTEFTLEENIKLVKEYVKNNFIDKGMCADVCIHDKQDGNPHAHIILTMRKIDEEGKFSAKSEKQYLCRNTENEEKYFNSKDLKINKGFEKVYKCRCKNDYKELTNAELRKEEHKNYKKVSKYPVDKKIDICADWNDKNNVEIWREKWAKVNNELFKKKGMDIQIDHRSYERQNINIIPTIHEGSSARVMQKKGKESDRIDINKYIKKLNMQIKEYESDIHKLKNEMKQLNKDIEKTEKTNNQKINIDFPSSLSNESTENIASILQELKEKSSEGLNKRLGIEKALTYIEKQNIKTIDDVKTIKSQITDISSDYTNKLNRIDTCMNNINLLYERLTKKIKEVSLLEKEVEGLGIFKFRQKKYLEENIQKLKNEIKELKESEFYQRDIKYSQKMTELKKEKEECQAVLKKCDNENSILYDIEVLNKDKDKLINSLNRNKDIKLNIKSHSDNLER